MNKNDYLYCKTCNALFDFWKYDYNLADAGHEGCEVRPITDAEFAECLLECQAAGCLDEYPAFKKQATPEQESQLFDQLEQIGGGSIQRGGKN